ncbi:Mmt2p Ecym_2167 [Eremothecium cymbalariae DBVPG|uniref:Cation efflux protein transmembrane domain-containing protein n=1 Tax=Eremothecium cymbalariae (strain CBS 270.75 / DBVPG 7215 / KCTC 17166 / NRRL Y-17582) TaxID=931890 RepID=G8JNK3_ERECY|nr:Hypothetical protein Ecym_2167 [Eremothecium cymbalariae DBVPG\
MMKLGLPVLSKFGANLPFFWTRTQKLNISTRLLKGVNGTKGEGFGKETKKGHLESELEGNPEFHRLAEEYHAHDHLHLKDSETEKPNTLNLGTMATRVGQHAHFHAHSHVNPLLVLSKEEFRKNPGVRITWIGLASNVGLAVGKFVGGVVFNSQALIADAVHALSDLVSDFLTLFSVSLASRKPTKDYPYGYGKIETVGSLAVSSILTMAGISIGWSSLCAILGPFVPHAILEVFTAHSHLHSHTQDITNINAAWIAGGSIILKEWIFRATKKVATQTNSNVLMANAWHHRVDSLTSLVALVTISSAYFFNMQSLDAVGGLLVSALVVNAGYKGMKISVKELVDHSLPPTDAKYLELQQITTQTLNQMLSNNNAKRPYSLKELVVLMSGPNVHSQMVIEAPLQRWGNVLSTSEFELVTDHVRSVLYDKIPNLKKVHIEFTEEKSENKLQQQQKGSPTHDPSVEHKHSDHCDGHSNSHSGCSHIHKH